VGRRKTTAKLRQDRLPSGRNFNPGSPDSKQVCCSFDRDFRVSQYRAEVLARRLYDHTLTQIKFNGSNCLVYNKRPPNVNVREVSEV
jgi:hypothetical protein